MEVDAQEASNKLVASANKKLSHALKQKEIDFAGLEPILEKVRVRSGNLALLLLTTDQPADQVESKLWKCHIDVNGRYKAWLSTFRDVEGRKRPVERRKAEKMYADFIKASQRFYRAYVGRLVANFTDIPKVQDVAQRLGQVGLVAQEPKSASLEQQKLLDHSCKLCVIRLGDLSRWKETELQAKERNWGPAIGYYNLALSMDPSEGTCYNQLAVISRNDEDHLGAVYHLLRATSVENPFHTAGDNIRTEFGKLLVRMENSYGLIDRSGDDIVKALEKRFLAFHAHCYTQPYDFVAFQQKASDILGMIALCFQDTRRGSFDHFLQKACLINISAEGLARRGMTETVLTKKQSPQEFAQETDRSCQSYFLLQRFNLMSFQSLLRVLAREIGEPVGPGENLADMSRLSVIVHRVLPALRQYSSWFLSHMRELIETKFKSSRKFLEQVIKTYAQTLNLLKSNVDVFAKSQVPHLLDEDEKTLSFSPFASQVVRWRYYRPDQAGQATLRPIRHDQGQGKEMSEELAETHLRATDLIVDALRLVKHQDDLNLSFVPLALDNGNFIEQGIPESEIPKRPESPPKQVWKGRNHAHTSSLNGIPNSPGQLELASMAPPAILTPKAKFADASEENTTNGKRISQNLDIRESIPNMIEEMPSTLNSSSLIIGTPAPSVAPPSSGLTAMDLVRRMQNRSTAGSPVPQRSPDSLKKHASPSLPSVLNTPFAPTASEQAQLSPRLDHAQRRSPSFTTPQSNSSAVFRDTIAQQQRDIQSRTSPQSSFQPTQSWLEQTPTGMNTMFRAFENKNKMERTPSPYVETMDTTSTPSASHLRNTPQKAPFGVIGQARPVSRGTPTSGQV